MVIQTQASNQKAVRYGLILALIIVVAFVVRLNWLLQREQIFPWAFFDEFEYYVSTANNAFLGRGFFPNYNSSTDGIYVPPPLQSLFILFFYFLADQIVNPFWIKLAQIFLFCGSLVLVAEIGKHLATPMAGLIFAGLLAIHPHFVFWSAILQTENNFLAMLIVFLYLLIRWRKQGGIKWAFLASCLLGLLHLQRINLLFFGAILSGFSFLSFPTRKGLAAGLIFLFVPFLFIAPWFLRNWKIYHEPILINSNGGILFHFGNRINLDPLKMPYVEIMDLIEKPGPYYPEVEKIYRGPDHKLNVTYYKYSKVYQDIAIRYILHHPLHFTKNYFLKLYNEFALNQDMVKVCVPSLSNPIVFAISHFVILFGGLGGLGLLLLWQRNHAVIILSLMFVYFTFFGALLTLSIDGRMNLYLRFLQCGFLAAGLEVLWIRWSFFYTHSTSKRNRLQSIDNKPQ